MARLLFEKTGNSIWISHLDLMRVFQRAFKRAGLPLKHTQGFNPRPSVSIALPLSVGVSSYCELLDFELDGETVTAEEIRDRLNRALIGGVQVREVYEAGRKLKELALLHCRICLTYDAGVMPGTVEAVRELFCRASLPVEKKGKTGPVEQDIIPMIRRVEVSQSGENHLILDAVICCQNPSLNPSQLIRAVEIHLPESAPSHGTCTRLEIYDTAEKVFR